MTFVLRVGRKTVEVPEAWVSRWTFISDIYHELGERSVKWTYSPLREVEDWVLLNRAMDNKNTTHIPLSSIWATIQFMNPTDTSYLRHLIIDPALPDPVRKRLLGELGSSIRQAGKRPQYNDYNYPSGTPGLYYHFYLDADPAWGYYNVNKGTTVALENMREDTRALILSMPLDIITGIMYQTHLKSVGQKRTREDHWMEEIPWYYVNWKDVALFAANRVEDWDLLTNDFFNLVVLDDENRIYWSREDEWVQMEQGTLTFPLWRALLQARTPVQLYYDNRKSLLDSIARNLEVYERRMPNELPFRLTEVLVPTVHERGYSIWLQNSVGHVKLIIPRSGKLTVQIPHFADFWNAQMRYMSRTDKRVEVPSDDVAWDDFGLYVFAGSVAMYKARKAGRNGLHEVDYALFLMNLCLFCNDREQRQVDSVEFPDVCRRIEETLGTKTLEAYSNHLLLLSEAEDIPHVPRLRLLAFVEAAVGVIGEEPATSFLTFPSIPPDVPTETFRKPKPKIADEDE